MTKYYYQIEGKLRNNIGDVLQGFVAKCFLPRDAVAVVDREVLADMDANEDGFLIANGWYMHSFERFPPPPNITPLYVAVHIADSAMLRVRNIREHFQKHAPIGCRDRKTVALFLGWGVPAYYSGCLTITTRLEDRPAIGESSEVLLVDGVDHPVPAQIKKKLESVYRTRIRRVTHDPPNPTGEFENYAVEAEEHLVALLERYSTAKLIITTKIHCALPCLGLGLDVLMIHPNLEDPRLETVRKFIDVLSFEDVAAMQQPITPSIRVDRLLRARHFIAKIVADSVAAKSNVVQSSYSPKYLLLRWQSRIAALIYRIGVLLALASGLGPDKITRIYGNR